MESMPKAVPEAENFEVRFGQIQGGPETSSHFPDKQIFTFTRNGEFVMYALGRSSSGELEGSEFTLSEKEGDSWRNSGGLRGLDTDAKNTRVDATYELHAPDLKKLEKVLSAKGVRI